MKANKNYFEILEKMSLENAADCRQIVFDALQELDNAKK
jgi:hypothetical protein